MTITMAQGFGGHLGGGGGQAGQAEPLAPDLRNALGSEGYIPQSSGGSSGGPGQGQGGGRGPKARRWHA